MSHADLVALLLRLVAENEKLHGEMQKLRAEREENSGNSSKPPSRDPAVERQRQAKQRAERLDRAGRPKRQRGKRRGSKGAALELSPDPDVIVNHHPERCECCEDDLADTAEELRVPPGGRAA